MPGARPGESLDECASFSGKPVARVTPVVIESDNHSVLETGLQKLAYLERRRVDVAIDIGKGNASLRAKVERLGPQSILVEAWDYLVVTDQGIATL
jgi:hypothetical protein